MTDTRDRCPEGIEEAARWRSRRGIPQPLAGRLCGDGGCAQGYTPKQLRTFMARWIRRFAQEIGGSHADAVEASSWPLGMLTHFGVVGHWSSFICDAGSSRSIDSCRCHQAYRRCCAAWTGESMQRVRDQIASVFLECLPAVTIMPLLGSMAGRGFIVLHDPPNSGLTLRTLRAQLQAIAGQYGTPINVEVESEGVCTVTFNTPSVVAGEGRS